MDTVDIKVALFTTVIESFHLKSCVPLVPNGIPSVVYFTSVHGWLRLGILQFIFVDLEVHIVLAFEFPSILRVRFEVVDFINVPCCLYVLWIKDVAL